MTKDEYVKTLEKRIADEESDIMHDDYCDGYVDGLKKAIVLSKQLDEPEKVVIPEFIANDIKYHKKHGSTLRGALGSAFDSDEESNVYYWFFTDDGDENVRKYINAWNNGYEIEKEPKYLVKIKGICQGNQWLKDNWPEYEAYNNAGLLEFEEAEDDK